MLNINKDDPLATSVVNAIRSGDTGTLARLIRDNPDLPSARLDCGDGKMSRTLLHIVTDWPGHFPNCGATIALLVNAGAEVNARFIGRHTETPLHWAASSDDIEALDALLDAGANIETPGAVIGQGTPLDDAVAFGQWNAARRLIERGAKTKLWHAAALGLMDQVEAMFADVAAPTPDEITNAFWFACHGGQRKTAEFLLNHGANLNWIPHWEERTPLDTARRAGADELIDWLIGQGARSAEDLRSNP